MPVREAPDRRGRAARGSSGLLERDSALRAIDRITPLVDSLKKGTVPSSNQGFLGVSIQNAPSGGAQITAITAGSPAATAGLQVGDVITAVNGQAVATSAEAADAVSSNPAGSKVTIKFQRGGASRTATATLTTRPATG